MDNSRRSIVSTEETVYLSFDTEADDTLASRWQSVMATQTSHYLEVQSMELELKHNETLEEKQKSVLDSLLKNDSSKDQISPLRPFDKNILNKHNALSSTPTKNLTITDSPHDVTASDPDNKENTQPDEQNSTFSSTINATALTVKANTMLSEGNVTLEDTSVKENKSNVYPLNANVVLENITEVSNEEPNISVASPMPVAAEQENKVTETVVTNMVHEVSELIAKALKLTEGPVKEEKASKLPTIPLPRPRRSFLPTSSGTTFKQRMSIVVKTTLNSPARKLALSNAIPRRSCLPTTKTSLASSTGYRKSMVPRCSESASTKATPLVRSSSSQLTSEVTDRQQQQKQRFKCHLCRASFCEKGSLDKHMESHSKPVSTLRNKNGFFCKYCDKKFVLERALHIHLMQNCDKIPPIEKRKLQFTELNHVTKAKLPKLIGSSPAVHVDSVKPREKAVLETEVEPQAGKFLRWPGKKSLATAALEAADENAVLVPKETLMGPPSAKKVIKKVAHAGVYRTPTKTVPCHICKQSFKSILDYTNHCLTVHSKNKKQNKANALFALSAQEED